ncbi:NHEJ1 [Acanthosepion pharaonis]|uniref:Non-homologous end-joining factor 1 n=1 Tax=Acanthosepion pharaonis TaxID=158019 RepID=A0A812EJ49_ACAPH|nr:NHEJ1 [Sepia pharaonis]
MNNASDNETVTQHTNNNKHVVHIKPKFEDCNMTTTGLLLSGVVDNNNADETEWRRDWQPDLKCCPWKVLQADHYVYLVKANFLHDSYQFLITDLNHFWYESITHSEFLNRLQELNPNLEAPTTKILDHIKTNLEKNSSDNLSISKEESKSRLHLWINSDLAGFPFCWQMIGESAHEEMVSENTTIPLLMMVSELYRRQKALLRIIFEKDKEIENYKAQGCKLTKKNIATVPFDETVFEHSMVFSQEFEDNVKLLGTTAFESSGQELYQNIMTKYTWLHRCTKTEPELSKSSLEEPNTVFQQLEELSASVEGEDAIQVGKVEVDEEQVPIYECSQCIFSTASQDLLVQHISLYHSDPFVNTTPDPIQQTPNSISLGMTPPLQLQPVPQTTLLPQSSGTQKITLTVLSKVLETSLVSNVAAI